MSADGSLFEWHCGTCTKVVAAEDLETLRADVLNHIREARQRGVTEPRCGHCGQPISEAESSLLYHTNYSDDLSRSLFCADLWRLANPGERGPKGGGR